uniref:DUF4220 domain-containing protein n=1 Tax=Oryza punctata TaxID=4537 RepID=A0A0E0LGT6_ORYPU
MQQNATSFLRSCSDDEVRLLKTHAKWEIWRVNSLSVVNVMLMGVVVGIGAYAPRYRHHPLTRFLFQGAAALFMPIVSYVVSASGYVTFVIYAAGGQIFPRPTTVTCLGFYHTLFILQWTLLVQIAAINTIPIVAADARELGRSIAPSALLLIHAIWTCYLVIYFLGTGFGRGIDFSVRNFSSALVKVLVEWNKNLGIIFMLVSACLIFVKLVFKLGAFFMARESFALGRNPRLVLGYMKVDVLPLLHDVASSAGPSDHVLPPPPLLVMGEDIVNVQKGPNSYILQQRAAGLVTLDKVWQLMDDYTNSLTSRTQGQAGRLLLKLELKDVCLSFALFKLLRCCRFASLSLAVLLTLVAVADWLNSSGFQYQLLCTMPCKQVGKHSRIYQELGGIYQEPFGSIIFDLVPVILLCLLLVLSEARDIASLFCSNWTKVVLICRYLVLGPVVTTNHHQIDTISSSPALVNMPTPRRWVGCLLFRCNYCKLVNNPWKDNINLCSILEMTTKKRSTPCHLLPIRRLIPTLPLPEKAKNVKVPDQVKSAIIDKLRSSKGRQLTKGTASLGSDNNHLLWACSCGAERSSTTDVLLVWHIATTILEVRYPSTTTDSSSSRVVATHLSGYCAYLVAYCPELLPDDDGWSKDLYKDVKEDARRALSAGRVPVSTPEEECKKLIRLLSAGCRHEVLRNGAKLAEQLVALVQTQQEEDEGKAWKVLAGFWSEMILYLAPSDNLDGHAAAIARGGELITLLWALLTHVGIITRSSTATATATPAAAAAADNESASSAV